MMSPSRWERAAFWSAMLGFEVIDERPYSNGRHPATGRHDQPLPHTRTQTSLSRSSASARPHRRARYAWTIWPC